MTAVGAAVLMPLVTASPAQATTEDTRHEAGVCTEHGTGYADPGNGYSGAVQTVRQVCFDTVGPAKNESTRQARLQAPDDQADLSPASADALPEGYEIPADASPQAQSAIRWALRQLGSPYQWGGTCTEAHRPKPMARCDCSSRRQQAHAMAGVSLSRTTYTQINEVESADSQMLRPGDLLFTTGTPEVPEHVGMFIDHGLVLRSPRTGDVVRVASLTVWQQRILATRRIVR